MFGRATPRAAAAAAAMHFGENDACRRMAIGAGHAAFNIDETKAWCLACWAAPRHSQCKPARCAANRSHACRVEMRAHIGGKKGLRRLRKRTLQRVIQRSAILNALGDDCSTFMITLHHDSMGGKADAHQKAIGMIVRPKGDMRIVGVEAAVNDNLMAACCL